MGGELSLAVAFGAGVVSFLSPCVLPLFPSYLSFITGLTFDELAEPDPPPASWDRAPEAPFDPRPSGGSLPWSHRALTVTALSDRDASIAIGNAFTVVPRYWLARMLFRLALHGFALGYVETYGGFFYDDRGTAIRLGVRGGGHVEIARADPASGATRAGALAGDLIVSIDGRRVRSIAEVQRIALTHRIGQTLRLEVSRAGRTQSVAVLLEARP